MKLRNRRKQIEGSCQKLNEKMRAAISPTKYGFEGGLYTAASNPSTDNYNYPINNEKSVTKLAEDSNMRNLTSSMSKTSCKDNQRSSSNFFGIASQPQNV